ncbi:MAG: HAMP domain-containing sensor histidine kinase, partial [Actinomycetota bacterium]
SLAASDLTTYAAEILRNPSGLSDDSANGALVYIRDPSGTVRFDSMTHDLHEAVDHRTATNAQLTISADRTDYSVVGRAVTTGDGVWALWAARSEASDELTLSAFDRILIVGGLALLAGFGLASWVLSTAALRPVTRMRLEAEKLESGDGSGRLPVGPAQDEIAALANTLNAFLDRVRRTTDRERQVLSDAAHELRTPLAALTTQLELAHDSFGDAEALAAQVLAAERSVTRLSALAANLLALSRLDAGELDLSTSTADRLVDEFMNGVDRARLVALSTDADVAYSLGVPEAGAAYRTSPTAFSRIIDNLTANALSAAGTRGRVTMSLQQHASQLILTVTDDGPGMPPDFLARAFDRFSRADDSRASSTGGSGLGLALVHALSSAAGGSVAIENLEPGFSVRVALPAVKM